MKSELLKLICVHAAGGIGIAVYYFLSLAMGHQVNFYEGAVVCLLIQNNFMLYCKDFIEGL